MLPIARTTLVNCSRRIPRTVSAVAITGARNASHGAHYNEPTGWLFSEKPPPPGQKRKREDWEVIWYVGMFGSMATAAVLMYYKPDTSIQTSALAEAKKRMEARGEATDYVPTDN